VLTDPLQERSPTRVAVQAREQRLATRRREARVLERDRLVEPFEGTISFMAIAERAGDVEGPTVTVLTDQLRERGVRRVLVTERMLQDSEPFEPPAGHRLGRNQRHCSL